MNPLLTFFPMTGFRWIFYEIIRQGSTFIGTNCSLVLICSRLKPKSAPLLRLVGRQDDDDDIVGLLEAVGHQLFSETKELIPNKTTYHAGIHLYLALDCVSPTLLGLQAKLSKKTEAYCARCNHWEILCVA